MQPRKISLEQLRHAINLRDLSNPAEGPHAMQRVMDQIIHALKEA